METIQTNFTDESTLLIQGVKGKIDKDSKIINEITEIELRKFIQSFKILMEKPAGNNV